MSFPDAWTEVALVSVVKYAAVSPVERQYGAVTETIDINEGSYPGESIPNLAGGRIWKQSPQEDGEVTLELYPIELGVDDSGTPDYGFGFFQEYNGGDVDASEPLTTDTSWPAGTDRSRDRFRISILWTNDSAATNAAGATAVSTDSLRFSAMGCRIVSHEVSYTDGIVKATVTFKFPAMNKAGTVKMCQWESGDNTALPALTAYDDDDAWS